MIKQNVFVAVENTYLIRIFNCHNDKFTSVLIFRLHRCTVLVAVMQNSKLNL